MLEVAAAHTIEFEADRIVDDLVETARNKLDGTTPRAGLVFSAIDLDHDAILDGLTDAFEGIQLVGGTTDGELTSERGFEEDSVAAIFFGSDELDFGTGVATGLSTDPAEATRRAVDSAREAIDGEPSLCITTPEGLEVNSTTLLQGLRDQLGEKMPIVGGLAGDQFLFESTYQFGDDQVYEDAVPVLLMGGDVVHSHGVASGWEPLGKRAEITRAEGNVIYEIDDQTAVDFYRHFIGDGVINDGVYPLAIFDEQDEQDEDFYLRAPVGYDEDEGSVTFFGNVTPGATVQITRGERSAIIEATRTSAANAYDNFDDDATPRACLAFSCAGRHQLLGQQTSREYEILEEVVDEDIEVCGFYTYGEISPLVTAAPSRFHNDTFVTVLLGS